MSQITSSRVQMIAVPAMMPVVQMLKPSPSRPSQVPPIEPDRNRANDSTAADHASSSQVQRRQLRISGTMCPPRSMP